MRVTAGGQNMHPSAAETTRGLLALVYERDGQVWRTYSLDRGLTWAQGQRLASGAGGYQPRAKANYRFGFALTWSGQGGERDIYFEEINEVMTISDDLITARIGRSQDATSKGMALEINNPRRKYDPEVPNTRWSGVFYPGALIELKLGYHGELLTRFRGYLDDTEMDDETATISVSARGEFKQLLDQHLRTKRFYTNKKAVAIIAELAIEAGIDADKVQVQDAAQLYSGEFDRTRTFGEVIQEMCDLVGFELIEPDEGGLIARAPSTSTTPVWFFEEDANMYERKRKWDDDEVYTRVQVFREDKLKDDGSGAVALAGFTVERIVDTELLTPAGKTYFEEAPETMTEEQAGPVADLLARQIGRRGSQIQVACPLNVVLEVGDVVQIRRKSISQSGVYIITDLDDDCQRIGDGQARDPGSGQFVAQGGGGRAFANTVQAERVA